MHPHDESGFSSGEPEEEEQLQILEEEELNANQGEGGTDEAADRSSGDHIDGASSSG